MSEEEVKRVMDEMPYGLYIIGTQAEGEANVMLADWVMQVSFQPRLIAISFENDARSLQNIRATRAFSVNMLSQDKESMELASRFAQPYHGAKVKGRKGDAAERVHHKLEEVPHTTTERGCPVLEAAMAWLECEAESYMPAGDHTLAVARVVDGQLRRTGEPLTSTYTGWTYSG